MYYLWHDARCGAFACGKKTVYSHDTNAKISKVSPSSKIFIQKLYTLKNSKFYCQENYGITFMLCMKKRYGELQLEYCSFTTFRSRSFHHKTFQWTVTFSI